MICKQKMPKTNIAMSSSRKGNNNTQPDICGICLCRTCNAQFGVIYIQIFAYLIIS